MRILPILILVLIAKVLCGQRYLMPNASTSLSQFTVINTGTTEDLMSISKINNNILISGYNNYLAKSYNNCNTLIPVTTPVFIDAPQNRYFRTLRLDTNYIYMSYKNASANWKFYKSVDGGNNWITKKDTSSTNFFFCSPTLLFFDTIHGAIMFDGNTTINTINGLTTYTASSWVNGWLGAVSSGAGVVIDDSTAVFGEAQYGGAYLTKNRGKTWQSVDSLGGAPSDFEVVNKDSIYYVSTPPYSWFGDFGCFGYTFDSGLTWSYKIFSSPTAFSNVCVKNKNEIYILARNGLTPNSYQGNGVILKTTDLGQTWYRFVTPFVASLSDMKFLNDSIALISGEGGLLFKWNTKTSVFVGLKENNSDNSNISIYPNPANGILNIDCSTFASTSSATNLKLEIINSLGQVVYQSTLTNTQSKINIEALSNGIYFVQIESNTKVIGRSKFVKQ